MTAILSIFTTFIWPLIKGLINMALEFAKTPGNWVVAGLAVMIAFGVGHHEGKVKERGVWQARIEAEREKQAQIVFRADNKALAEITRLNTEQEQSNAQINELLIEAEKDTNAARPALGIDSVRRIRRGPGKPR